MKKAIFIIFLVIMLFNTNIVYAGETEEIIKEQEETLGIGSFIKEAEKYTSDNFEDINMSALYKDALSGKMNKEGIVKGIINSLGKEVSRNNQKPWLHTHNHNNT